MVEEYELNESRYYPSVYRLTDGRIGAFGGQAIHTPTTFVGPPYEINPNKTTLMTAWDQPIEDDWDFVNYPHLFHISSNEMFFAGLGDRIREVPMVAGTASTRSTSTSRTRRVCPRPTAA